MTGELEWSGTQQLLLLLQSSGLGVALGLLFDVLGGLLRAKPPAKWMRFIADTLFGLVAGLVTFYASLAIMDGQLHPLLFVGSGIGFAAAHLSVGMLLAKGLCRARRSWMRMWAVLGTLCVRFLGAVYDRICRLKGKKGSTSEENAKKHEKNRKKPAFFQKKS